MDKQTNERTNEHIYRRKKERTKHQLMIHNCMNEPTNDTMNK